MFIFLNLSVLDVFAGDKAEEGKPEAVEESTEKKLEDLPSRMTASVDDMSQRWGLLSDGALSKGSGGFAGAMALSVGKANFAPEEAWEDTENARYRMKGQLSGLAVERRIVIDRKLGAARYLDTFHNSSDEDVTLTFTYRVGMLAAAEKIYTSRGRELTANLGARDFGIAIELAEDSNKPGALLVLAHERSRQKPKVIVADDRKSVLLDHKLTVKGGQKAALLTWVVQAKVAGAQGLEMQFAPFYKKRRLVAPTVSDDRRELVVNFPASDDDIGGGADYLTAVMDLSDRLKIDRAEDEDQMRVENGSVLTGDATGSDLVIDSRFGKIDVLLAEVAVLKGAAGAGREHGVFLRDGTVYTGEVSIDDLGLKGGFEVSLQMAQLDYLFYRESDQDGEFPDGTDAFVKLHSGDVVPVRGAAASMLSLISPWGKIDVKLSEIEWMRHVREPSPRYRMALTDGSLLTCFLDPGEMKLNSVNLGEQSIQATEVAAMWGAEVELPDDFTNAEGVVELTEIPKSISGGACLLSGSNLMAGKLANDELHVSTGATVTKVKLSDIVRMWRDVDDDELVPIFTIELGSGDELTGSLQERVIEIQSGERTSRVPVQHFLAMRSKSAPPKEENSEAEEEAVEEKKSSGRAAGRRTVVPKP